MMKINARLIISQYNQIANYLLLITKIMTNKYNKIYQKNQLRMIPKIVHTYKMVQIITPKIIK